MACIGCAADGIGHQNDAIAAIHRAKKGCEHAEIGFGSGDNQSVDTFLYRSFCSRPCVQGE